MFNTNSNNEYSTTYTKQLNKIRNQKNKNNLSGSELNYNPKKLNNYPYLRYSNNCYNYILNNYGTSFNQCQDFCHQEHKEGCPKKTKKCRQLMKQPGNGILNSNDYNCSSLEKIIMEENPSLYKSSYKDICQNGFYKIASVVDPKKAFHFYRQNSDGTWSHKPGSFPVTNKDASGKIIKNLHQADRNYSHLPNKLKYTDFCNYYCIKNNSNK